MDALGFEGGFDGKKTMGKVFLMGKNHGKTQGQMGRCGDNVGKS